jgi:hypothetical protein
MAKFLPFGLWTSAAAGVIAIVLIGGYAARNDSGHTGWEPFTSFILFVPLAVIGGVLLTLRGLFVGITRPSAFALAVGLAGVILIVCLDRTNRLVQYNRWVQRGMP